MDNECNDNDRGIPIRSVSRAISVLQAINSHSSLTMTQIATDSGVPYPTACRIVKTLLYEGLIEREDKTKRYRPTAKVRTLASGYDHASNLVEVARPLMERLTIKVGWPISLTTRVGRSMVLAASTHAMTSLTFNEYERGYAMPILECAAGMIYLANCEQSVRDAILGQLHQFGDDETRHMVQLAGEGGLLETIRKDGYATRSFVQHTRNPGKTSAIAVPVMHDDKIEGALTVAVFSSTIDLRTAVRDLMPGLRDCAAEISSLL
ncbi:IclR family transcriptional regulator [Novosphingobium sp. PC22D]|nr:IclR family transcriptional regulator [Novosphingobium sp. PC22D]